MERSQQLREQVEKIFRMAKINIKGTRMNYKKDCLLFSDWLFHEYRLQKLKNIRDEHLVKYVKHLQREGISAGTVKKKLAAIRYMHRHIPHTRHELTQDNSALGAKRRKAPGDRAWTGDEVIMMLSKANETSAPYRMAELLILVVATGMRIEEAMTLRDSDLRRALKNDYLYLTNTKGGRKRNTRDLDQDIIDLLHDLIKNTQRGHYVFIPDGRAVHLQIKTAQTWIKENRPYREGEQLTMHGLRYSYVQRELQEGLAQGLDYKTVIQKIAYDTGHNRTTTTAGYARGVIK